MYFQCISKFSLILSKRKFHLRNILLSNKAALQIKTQLCNSRFIYYRANNSLCFNVGNVFGKRKFHTSNCNNGLTPIIWVVIRSLTEFGAMIMGRRLRIWWKYLPDNKRIKVLNNIKRNQTNLMFGYIFFGGLIYTFYITHLVEDPISKRKRFIMFSENKVMEMAMSEVNFIIDKHKDRIIKSGFEYKDALRICKKILSANSNLPGTKRNWQVIMINDIRSNDVFVSLSGHIFIFTGIFQVVHNPDQLAGVIAHEIAHVLLCHPVEVVSKMFMLELTTPLILFILCASFPGSLAFYFLITKCVDIFLFYLPLSRSLELEADSLGLEIMSRACFNPKQVSLFWKNMDTFDKSKNVEWLSTHPSHNNRYKMVNDHMSKAMNIFSANCISNDMSPELRK